MTDTLKPDQDAPVDAMDIAGYPVLALDRDQLGTTLTHRWQAGEQCCLFFVNTNFVNQCEALRPRLRDEAVLLVNDGIGMDLACWLLHRKRFPANLNGTDFVPWLLPILGGEAGHTATPARVFLFGAAPGVAQRAAGALKASGVEVVGVLNGYGEARDDQAVTEAINRSGANVVLVAMGNPMQEGWILEHRHHLQARLLVGVGALLDFLAGEKPRAPAWVRRFRLEWLYRMSLEPRRLGRRYTIDIVRFLRRCRAWQRQPRFD